MHRLFAVLFALHAAGCEGPQQPCGVRIDAPASGCFAAWDCTREGQLSLSCVPGDAGGLTCTCRAVRDGVVLPERTFEATSCPLAVEGDHTAVADTICGWRIAANRRDAP